MVRLYGSLELLIRKVRPYVFEGDPTDALKFLETWYAPLLIIATDNR